MSCTTGCPTQDHANWGECVRDKGFRIAYCNSARNLDYTAQKKDDAELQLYRDAVKQGISPESTRTPDIRRAIDISNDTGVAYGPKEGNR